jgi:pilus assembly protein CpaB
MNIARLAIVGAAIFAGAAALYLLSGDPPPAPTVEVEVPKIDTQDVLIAAREIPLGTVISDLDLQWVAWPTAAVSPVMISRVMDAAATQTLKGAVARASLMPGEPIRREKLVKGTNAGFLSAILPSGMRAMSIPIESNGTTNAGGFILPNDRVDVMRTGADRSNSRGGPEGIQAEIVASDVRVLAIGRFIQEMPGGDRTVQGPNATLEVTPQQAQDIAVAQQGGSFSLVLRSLVDAGKKTNTDKPQTMTVIRFGVETPLGRVVGR